MSAKYALFEEILYIPLLRVGWKSRDKEGLLSRVH